MVRLAGLRHAGALPGLAPRPVHRESQDHISVYEITAARVVRWACLPGRGLRHGRGVQRVSVSDHTADADVDHVFAYASVGHDVAFACAGHVFAHACAGHDIAHAHVLIMITGQAPHAPGGLSSHSAERPCCAHPDPFAADLPTAGCL